MIAQVKKLVIVSALAITASAAVLAAPQYSAPQFDPATTMATFTLAYNTSQDAYIMVPASQLLDANDLIRVAYGVANLGDLVQIKQVIAPEGVTISLTDWSISTVQNNSMLKLELEASSTVDANAQYPVQVILENKSTGETTTVNLLVQTSI